MTPELARAARALLSSDGGNPSSAAMAERGVHALEQLGRHLSRIVGTTGMLTVFHRSIVLSTVTFPWLAGVKSHDPTTSVYDALRISMAAHPPDVVTESFIFVLSTFIGLLGRLIGESLVWRLVQEVWPAIFVHTAKESS